MAESIDVVKLTNPTKEEFSHHYNGELYTLGAEETRQFSRPLGFHLAHHLSKKMVVSSFSQKDRNDNKKAILINQLLNYDNPKKRIALYQILGNIDIVAMVIMSYPNKGFIGEMDEYKEYVKKAEENSKHVEKVKATKE